jgi:hypothetical protein
MKLVSFLAAAVLLYGAAAVARPCRTAEEIRAETIIGFFAAQRTTAELCDALLGEGQVMAGLHWQMIKAHRSRVVAADKAREGYFRRAYGERWKAVMDYWDREFLRVFPQGLRLSAQGCRDLRDEMGRRVAGGWPYIGGQIERQVAEGIRREIAPECGAL